MPVRSEAQQRFMYATAAGDTDAPPSVGREFLAASHTVHDLPERVPPMMRPLHAPKKMGKTMDGKMTPSMGRKLSLRDVESMDHESGEMARHKKKMMGGGGMMGGMKGGGMKGGM